MRAFELLSHAGRAKEIVGVLARFGFADWLAQVELPSGILQKLLPHPKLEHTAAEVIVGGPYNYAKADARAVAWFHATLRNQMIRTPTARGWRG